MYVRLSFRQGCNILQKRAGNHRLEFIGGRIRELHLGQGQTIRVGRNHLEVVLLERHQSTGENRTAFIFRDGARNLFNHRSKFCKGNLNALRGLHVGKTREILIVERLDRKRGTVAGDERILFVCLNMDCGVGQVFHDVGEQLAGNNRLTLLFHECSRRILDGKLKVGRLENERVTRCLEQNTGENGQSRAGGYTFNNNCEGVLEFAFADA